MVRVTFVVSLALSSALLASLAPPAAAKEKVLYSFKSSTFGYPVGRVHWVNGTLFGTGSGYNSGAGQVFELTNSGGSWTETSLLKFDGTDGASPFAGLVQDSSGILYGTTANGDANGGGNAFLLYDVGGSWIHGTLWAFPGAAGDGSGPACDLIMDSSGNNFFGTTSFGGAHGYGTVFELTHMGLAGWTETVLHSFSGGSDGATPYAGLVMDSNGALYGTASQGARAGCSPNKGCGTVFKLAPSGGAWNFSTLHSFTGGNDGGNPSSVLVLDSNGALYGTTLNGGGLNAFGTVFRVALSGGKWTEKVLLGFDGADGAYPEAGVRWIGSDQLGGTAAAGGAYNYGVAFVLSKSNGAWNEKVLHSFGGTGFDGRTPHSAIVADSSGNLYGTTEYGGRDNYGTVWEVTP